MLGLVPLIVLAVIAAVVATTAHRTRQHPGAVTGGPPAATSLSARSVLHRPPNRPTAAGPGRGPALHAGRDRARPAPPENTALTNALQRWLAAGLITPTQATAIDAHEASLELAAASPPTASTSVPRRRIPVAAEALGYLGGTLGIVGLTLLMSRYWPDMPTVGRLALTGGSAILSAVGGYLVHEVVDPAFTRLRWFLWLVSTAAAALFAGVLAARAFDADAASTIAFAVSLMVAVQNGIFWAGRPRPAQQLLALVGSMVAVGTLCIQFSPSEVCGSVLWVAGACVLVVGLLHRTTFPPLTIGVGAASMVVGAVIASQPMPSAAALFAVATTLGLLALATAPLTIGDFADRVMLTVVGAMGAVQTVPITVAHFTNEAGLVTGLVIWAAGGGLIFTASRAAVRSPIAVEVFGGIALVAGAAITGAQVVAFATLFGCATAITLIALSTGRGRVLLSLFGSIGLLVNVPWGIAHFFPGEGRAPLLILVSGGLIVLVAVWLARMGGRFRRELGH